MLCVSGEDSVLTPSIITSFVLLYRRIWSVREAATRVISANMIHRGIFTPLACALSVRLFSITHLELRTPLLPGRRVLEFVNIF